MTSATSEQAPTGVRRGDTYEHLRPLLARYAELGEDHPDRAELRDRLVRGFSPVVAHIAARYGGRGEPIEDLQQAGALGLIRAIDRFAPDRGSEFLAFAVPTITGEIRRHFRDRTWAVHVPRGIKELQARVTAAQQTLGSELERAPRVSELATHLESSRERVIDALAAQESYTAQSLDFPVGESGTTIGDPVADIDSRIDAFDAWEAARQAITSSPIASGPFCSCGSTGT